MKSSLWVLAALLSCNNSADRCHAVIAQTVLYEGYCVGNVSSFCFFEAEPGF